MHIKSKGTYIILLIASLLLGASASLVIYAINLNSHQGALQSFAATTNVVMGSSSKMVARYQKDSGHFVYYVYRCTEATHSGDGFLPITQGQTNMVYATLDGFRGIGSEHYPNLQNPLVITTYEAAKKKGVERGFVVFDATSASLFHYAEVPYVR